MLRASRRQALRLAPLWPAGCSLVKTQSNELRAGAVIEDREGRLLEVLRFEHTHGQGRASGHVQLEARDLRSGAKRTERFRPSDTVERVVLDEASYTYLFSEGRSVTLMHPETYEQLELPRTALGEAAPFLVEGCAVRVMSFNSEILSASLPEFVEIAVADSGPSMKARFHIACSTRLPAD
jgi:translation elongation factor P/translation initiation factor 5A